MNEVIFTDQEEPLLYHVYARANKNGKVEKIFSTCFEQPLETDILIKSGHGDEFVHVGYYSIYTNNFCHAYCIDNGIFRGCTQEEKDAEAAYLQEQYEKNRAKTDKEKIAELETQVADLTEIQADLLYEMCQNELSAKEV